MNTVGTISQFWVVLGWFHYEIRFPGEISCPGMLPDHSGIEFWLKIEILLAHYKNNQKYQLWCHNEFIIPPSSRALALHALIISPKPSGKNIKL